MTACHDDGAPPPKAATATAQRLIALVGGPNVGKTSVFNRLTGLSARTGNYPGVTVARTLGTCRLPSGELQIEDLPGLYSLDPLSPDEQVVVDALGGTLPGQPRPDALLVVLDGTSLSRSMGFLADVLHLGLPVLVVLTMLDDLVARGGDLDVAAFGRGIGVRALGVTGHRGGGIDALRAALDDGLTAGFDTWTAPAAPPPVRTEATVEEWGAAVLAAARYEEGSRHQVTHRLDGVLLHPVWGFATFLVVMFAFFQTVFAVAAPMQDAIGAGFGWLGGQVHAHVGNQLIASVLADAMLGGVGSVLVFVPQVALLFLLIGLLENVGYLPRAAYLMDRLMSLTGLDGRAFVAMLSSVACAVPGIMATRTIPSPRDRLATMLAAPLMTCSARLPVYVLLVGLLVDDRPRWGPVSAAGAAMFVLYVAGALSAMIAARVLRSTVLRGGLLPFSMDLPPYRMPSARTVLVSAWGSVRMFLRKAGTIILVSTLVLWVLLNVPFRAAETAGMGHVEAAQYVAEHSVAGSIGRAVEPAFEPLGFDWRIDLGLLGAMSAREVFVSTMGQVAAAADPADPAGALAGLRHGDGPRAGQRVLDGPTVIALLAWFVYALQCTSTIAVIRRESNSWRWPALAFGYLCALAWVMAFLARQVALALGVT